MLLVDAIDLGLHLLLSQHEGILREGWACQPATSIREVAGDSAEVGRQARRLNGAADAWLPHGPKQKPRATGGASWVSCWRACRSLPEDSKPTTPTPSRIIGCTARRTRMKKPRRGRG